MVRRASYLRGRKDRRDYPLSHGNFPESGECPGLADNSSSVSRRPPKHASGLMCRTIHQCRDLTGSQISGTAPLNGILNFPYRNFALLWL